MVVVCQRKEPCCVELTFGLVPHIFYFFAISKSSDTKMSTRKISNCLNSGL